MRQGGAYRLKEVLIFWGIFLGFPGGTSGKESHLQCRRCKRCVLNPWVGKIPWRRKWWPTPVFLPGKFHGQRSWWPTFHEVKKSQTWLSVWAQRTFSINYNVWTLYGFWFGETKYKQVLWHNRKNIGTNYIVMILKIYFLKHNKYYGYGCLKRVLTF